MGKGTGTARNTHGLPMQNTSVNHILFSLILSDIYFVDKVFGIVNPLFFPFLLSEVFELESGMKD